MLGLGASTLRAWEDRYEVVVPIRSGGAQRLYSRAQVGAGARAQVAAVWAPGGAEEALRAGAAAFLRKPLEPLTLVSTIRHLLGTSALVRPAAQRSSTR